MISSDAHPQVLEEVVFHLALQLGERNPVLKSIALGQASIYFFWISRDLADVNLFS